MGAAVPSRWPLIGRSIDLERCVEALADGETGAVFIHGAAGVGKSRLAEEVVARATSAGRATMRVRASVASSSIPLGAVAHLLPTELLDQRFDPLSVYGGVVASLRGVSAGSGRLVVLVDDVQWLDATSVALLGQLLDGGEIAVVATVRTGEDAPDAVVGLWRRDDVVRVDLTELTYDDVDSLLHLALGGPVDRGAVDRVWSASAGNALFVRELVLAALSPWRSGRASLGVVADRLAGDDAAFVGDRRAAGARRRRSGAAACSRCWLSGTWSVSTNWSSSSALRRWRTSSAPAWWRSGWTSVASRSPSPTRSTVRWCARTCR